MKIGMILFDSEIKTLAFGVAIFVNNFTVPNLSPRAVIT